MPLEGPVPSELAAEWVVATKFRDPKDPSRDLRPFLVGHPKQFLVAQGRVYCVRAHRDDPEGRNPELNPCEGCPHLGNGCEVGGHDDVELAVNPHPRRGIGYEERPFLVLRFRPGHSHDTLPRELWDNPYANYAMDEANSHFILTDPCRTKFHTLKGQVRFYGDEAEFTASPYVQYLEVFDDYQPAHRMVALDFSAIEPRVTTIVTREPKWIEVFEGTAKTVTREVRLGETDRAELPGYVYATSSGRTYCYLDGEMDKVSFEQQCRSCKLQNHCEVLRNYVKDVADDWHAINAAGLYGEEFTNPKDEWVWSKLRKVAKIVGLALTYGGTAWSVSRTMGTSRDEAQARINNFFSMLSVVSDYVRVSTTQVMRVGYVRDLLGRHRDMRKLTHHIPVDPLTGEADIEQQRKNHGMARRTALNYPIQGTAAEILKVAKTRVANLIGERGWNPLAGLGIPQTLRVGRGAYRSVRVMLASSVHDELLFGMRDDMLDEAVPPIYETMQVTDVMTKHLGSTFSLEMDCQYDRWRSWTSQTRYQAARAYLLRHLNKGEGDPLSPNLALVSAKNLDAEFLALCHAYVPEVPEAATFQLGTEVEGALHLHPKRFEISWLTGLGRPLRLLHHHPDVSL